MGKEIVINAQQEQTRIAILEDGELVELYIESPDNSRTIGDIYLGRVRKIMPSIQAAFVDIGQKQDAFLHFSDLSDHVPQVVEFLQLPEPRVEKVSALEGNQHRSRGRRHRPRGGRSNRAAPAEEGVGGADADGEEGGKRRTTESQSRGRRRSAQQRSKRGHRGEQHNAHGADEGRDHVRPETFLKRDQRILVKIVKEPISNKGSRISTDISLAGRFLVLVPFGNYVAVSKKIYSYKERRRLRALAKSLLPDGFGLIVRTVAEGKNAKTLDTDLKLLLEKWRKLENKLAGKPQPPLVVHQDVNMVSSVIRDLFSDDYDRIVIDDPRLFRNIKNYVQAVAPQMVKSVQLHKGKAHVFEAAKIDRDIAEAFEGRVDLPGGGYLFIEHTEAMHVVDVNSGRSGRGMTQEENSLKVNLEAARAIARQVRLRDLGGIIVVDFIDLREERNKKKVYDELKKAFRRDRAVSKILPMSDFGLIQITRQRMRPSVTISNPMPERVSQNGSSSSQKEQNGRHKQNPSSQKNQEPSIEFDGLRADDSEKITTAEQPPAQATPTSGDPEEVLTRMEKWLIDYKTMGNRRAVVLRVHPFTAAYLNRKVPNHPTRWFMKHLIRVRLVPDESVSPLSYRFFDARTGEDLTEKVTVPGGE